MDFLQFVLDKGQEKDWLSSQMILVSLVIAIVALAALVINEFLHEDPIMDLRLLKNRNFATAVTFSFVLGIVLNGTTILLPQFLQNSLGYTASLAGLTLSHGGIALAVMMPVAGIMASRFDPRVIIAIGFAATAAGLFHVTGIYYGIDFRTLVSFRILQVIGSTTARFSFHFPPKEKMGFPPAGWFNCEVTGAGRLPQWGTVMDKPRILMQEMPSTCSTGGRLWCYGLLAAKARSIGSQC